MKYFTVDPPVNLTVKKRFTVTEEHIKLLRRACIIWWPQFRSVAGDIGAPAIDCKRPYGNSCVEADVHEILTGVSCCSVDLSELPPDTLKHYQQLHLDTETALQIVLATGSFTPGIYEANQNHQDWTQVDEDTD